MGSKFVTGDVIIPPLKCISIIGSGTCNLACSYCFMCGLKQHKRFDEEVVNGLKDGSYLDNVSRIVKATHNNPNDIEVFSFWGGECTLHADLWAQYIQDWMDRFPNVRTVKFVSNGTFNPNHMFDLFKAINDWAALRKKHIYTKLQISVDGDDKMTLETRGVKASILQNNLIKLENLISDGKLNNIRFSPAYKPTWPMDLFNEMHSTLDGATEVWDYWNKYISDTIKNFKGKQTPSMELPMNPPVITMLYDYTQQQGIDFAKSLRTYDLVDWERLAYKYDLPHTLQHQGNILQCMEESTPSSLEYNSLGSCNQYLTDMLIRPDGVVAGCLVALYNNEKEYLDYAKENDMVEYENCLRVPDKYYFKPLEMTEEEILSFQVWAYRALNSAPTYAAANAAMIYELAHAGQIAPQYKNNIDMVLRHSYLIMSKTNCYYNSLRKTGIPYVSTLGQIRMYCNGALQYLDEKKRFYK